MEVYDVIIVGGGPAGLNAGVVLGRCRRKVLLFDSQTYRNSKSQGIHNYLTRDDILPIDFIELCDKELGKYGVRRICTRIINGRKNADGLFDVKDAEGNIYRSRKLLIATGVRDNVPGIPGFEEFYGTSVFHCPYCDGWEVKDQRLGVYAKNKNGAELALSLKAWSDHVTLFTDGGKKIKKEEREQLKEQKIEIIPDAVARLEGADGKLHHIVFKNGRSIPVEALFFVNGFTQQCDLAEVFNCEINRKGVVMTNRYQQTSTPGLFVAGDADKDVQFVIVAAAEGAKAGVIINKELTKENHKKK